MKNSPMIYWISEITIFITQLTYWILRLGFGHIYDIPNSLFHNAPTYEEWGEMIAQPISKSVQIIIGLYPLLVFFLTLLLSWELLTLVKPFGLPAYVCITIAVAGILAAIGISGWYTIVQAILIFILFTELFLFLRKAPAETKRVIGVLAAGVAVYLIMFCWNKYVSEYYFAYMRGSFTFIESIILFIIMLTSKRMRRNEK